MNPRFLPWMKLAWAWVTSVILCIVTIVILVWQTSGPGGRQAQIRNHIEDLKGEIARMEHMTVNAAEERTEVSHTTNRLTEIQNEVFGRLEERLTAVMREIGAASRSVGLLPEGFSYTFNEVWGSDAVRFSTNFSVNGTFEEVRELLILLQNSSQFLIIESIAFNGEEDPRSNNLGISLRVASFLTEVESERLQALVELLKFEPVEVEAVEVEAVGVEDGAVDGAETGVQEADAPSGEPEDVPGEAS